MDMADLLGLNKNIPEMVTLLEKIHTENPPFYVLSNLFFDYKKPPKLWQVDFLPLFDDKNVYLG